IGERRALGPQHRLDVVYGQVRLLLDGLAHHLAVGPDRPRPGDVDEAPGAPAVRVGAERWRPVLGLDHVLRHMGFPSQTPRGIRPVTGPSMTPVPSSTSPSIRSKSSSGVVSGGLNFSTLPPIPPNWQSSPRRAAYCQASAHAAVAGSLVPASST